MERLVHLIGLAVILAVGALIVMNFVNDPLAGRKQAFAEQMDQIPLTPPEIEEEDVDNARLRVAVAAKPKLWDALVEEKVAPPPPPRPPNLVNMLKGVTVTRQSIGTKVKVTLPKNDKGVWVEKGEQIVRGCVLKDFDKFTAVVSHYWAAGDKELTVTLTRK